jgi:hypothetical protein
LKFAQGLVAENNGVKLNWATYALVVHEKWISLQATRDIKWVISRLASILDRSGVLQGDSESKSLFEGKYPKGVGVGGNFVSNGHSLGSRVHDRPTPGVSRLNGMLIIKVKPNVFFVANKMSQNRLNRCSFSFS